MTDVPIRLIAKLDIKGQNLIKGLQFDGYRSLGPAAAYAKLYYEMGIDELFIQDVVASLYHRDSIKEVIESIASEVFIPITVAGGIRSLAQMDTLLRAGADKIAINTAMVLDATFVKDAINTFGSQNIVASIEVFERPDGIYEIWTHYGRQPTGITLWQWLETVLSIGVGEIFLSVINRDGMGQGFNTDLLQQVLSKVNIPVVIGSGAGKKEDFFEAAKLKPQGISAASVLHYAFAFDFAKNNPEFLKKYRTLSTYEEVDFGNSDFLLHGYGGNQDIMVKPSTIPEIKRFLKTQGCSIR